MGLAFDYIASLGDKSGLETEANYPYTAQDGKCAFDKTKGKASDKGHSDVTPNNVDQLKAAIAKGPVSVAIEADTFVF
jgi:Papain family cysteine protease